MCKKSLFTQDIPKVLKVFKRTSSKIRAFMRRKTFRFVMKALELILVLLKIVHIIFEFFKK